MSLIRVDEVMSLMLGGLALVGNLPSGSHVRVVASQEEQLGCDGTRRCVHHYVNVPLGGSGPCVGLEREAAGAFRFRVVAMVCCT